MYIQKIKLQKIFALISILLFLLSLTQVCFYQRGLLKDQADYKGWLLLLMGWTGLFSGFWCWLGNPLWINGLILFLSKKYRRGVWSTGLAILLMLSFTLYRQIPADESGSNYNAITSYGLGYWLWVASGLVLLVANIFGLKAVGDDNP
jgi:hypothetical protein